jgi:hypothetical protein
MHSRGYQFISREDLNIGPASGTASYVLQDTSGNPTGTYTTSTYLSANKLDPRYGSVIYLSNRGRLWYDGMAVSLRHRASKWLTGTLAYTWSHALDQGQGGAASNIYFTDPPASTINGNYQADKGSSALDQRQRLVISGILTLPKMNLGSRYVNMAVNGWQLSLIETAASPQYVDPILIVSSGLKGLASGTTINGMVTPFGAPARVPFLPRSSISVDTINRLDARITKMFAIRESMNLGLSFEAFNVFNIISNTSVVQNAYFANGNVIKAGVGVGTGTASSGFPDGTNARRAQVSARFTF